MSTKWLSRILPVLILFSVLNCCTYQKTHSRPKPQKLPVPVTVKPNTQTVVPLSPPEIVSPPPIQEPRLYVHRVRWKGETLFIIAKWYTGSGKNWKVLSNTNPNLNPNRILINDDIFIPEDLIINHKPMPLSFLSSINRKKRDQSIQSNSSSNENDVTEMFGPIKADLPSVESGKVELFGPIESDPGFIDSEKIELFNPIE